MASDHDIRVPKWYDEHLATPKFNGTYLKPLLEQLHAKDADIRRQAICALANLSDQPFRSSVAALKNTQRRSLLCDLFDFTRPPYELPQRKEAVVGLTNLLRNQTVHLVLLHENLLPDLIRLSRTGVRTSCMAGRKAPVLAHRRSIPSHPAATKTAHAAPPDAKTWDLASMRLIAFSFVCLCANEAVAPQLLGTGFVAELVRVSFGLDPDDAVVQRNAVNGLTLLSYRVAAQVEICIAGGLTLAELLLQHQDDDLRRLGGKLACNMCLHPQNKAAAAASPLLEEMLTSASEAIAEPGLSVGDEDELALAIATLTASPALLEQLTVPKVFSTLLALLRVGSAGARQQAAWALSNLATQRPTPHELLAPEMLKALIHCASEEGAPSRAGRRDALRTLSWMVSDGRLSPALNAGKLLEIVVQCSLADVDEELQNAALLVIASWAEVIQCHAQLVHGGALEPLAVSLRYASSPTAQLCGARALACLTVHRYYHPAILKSGAAEALVRLMRSPVLPVRKCACRAVCALSKDVVGALELLRVGGLTAGLAVTRTATLSANAEYAELANANMDAAFTIEKENAAREAGSLLELLAPLDVSVQEEEAVLSHSSVQTRVERPSEALVVPVFKAWRILTLCTKRTAEEREQSKAASRIQIGVREKSRKQSMRKESRAAARIQAMRRGQLTRRNLIADVIVADAPGTTRTAG